MRQILTLSAALLASIAFAHATVKTELGAGESLAGKSETYRLQVPVEREVATTQVQLFVPAGVKVSRFLPVPGFTRSVTRDANGSITSVTWRGRIQPLEFQRFLFQATNPADAGTLKWNVFQTYADGTVVKWDSSDPATPASTTTLK
ncbi:DUF1775 domain-containing protein [Deinococcus maricopensis]|uniref:Nuclear export factor GLE1 n=1 Tax=Deinococcus maricopensis (strain DSM 21211 / LMG 22137 / NRRL B-23946 / LB-34) TaxID=709986 RepID=E8UAZ2_DEIML|nr:DUF1775 domain-containing protein [Deinococcus maricopensis]ADV68231.1 nuclear export factor GLE1 [Deinococcus maricopensis DSM 21211]